MAQVGRRFTILHTESSLGWGGQEHRVLAEARILTDRGHRLLLACDPRGALYGRAAREGLPLFPVKFWGWRNVTALWTIRGILKAERVDILNTHSSLDSWVGTLAWGCGSRTVKLVRTRHLSTPVADNWPTRWLYRTPAAVITTGKNISDLLNQRLGIPSERLFIIPTGVAPEEFAPRPPDPTLIHSLNLPSGALVLGTVSVLRSWKGHLDLLEAFNLLVTEGEPAILLIVGEGPYRPVIEAKIAELGLQARVRLVGHQENVPAWLALMDVFVMASYANEGVPQALLQAMAMARPVAATAAGGIPEVIIPEKTGLLAPPRNPPALAQILARLCRDAALREALGQKGRELVLQRFSLGHMADRLERLYGILMAGAGDRQTATLASCSPKDP
jgi:glycosyltransferase involved in cell wall biosynthesis